MILSYNPYWFNAKNACDFWRLVLNSNVWIFRYYFLLMRLILALGDAVENRTDATPVLHEIRLPAL